MDPSVPLLNNALEHDVVVCVDLDSRWSVVTSESQQGGRETKQGEKRCQIRYSWRAPSKWATFSPVPLKNISRTQSGSIRWSIDFFARIIGRFITPYGRRDNYDEHGEENSSISAQLWSFLKYITTKRFEVLTVAPRGFQFRENSPWTAGRLLEGSKLKTRLPTASQTGECANSLRPSPFRSREDPHLPRSRVSWSLIWPSVLHLRVISSAHAHAYTLRFLPRTASCFPVSSLQACVPPRPHKEPLIFAPRPKHCSKTETLIPAQAQRRNMRTSLDRIFSGDGLEACTFADQPKPIMPGNRRRCWYEKIGCWPKRKGRERPDRSRGWGRQRCGQAEENTRDEEKKPKAEVVVFARCSCNQRVAGRLAGIDRTRWLVARQPDFLSLSLSRQLSLSSFARCRSLCPSLPDRSQRLRSILCSSRVRSEPPSTRPSPRRRSHSFP